MSELTFSTLVRLYPDENLFFQFESRVFKRFQRDRYRFDRRETLISLLTSIELNPCILCLECANNFCQV